MAMCRWIPDVKMWREAVFSGHFGPTGIGVILRRQLIKNVN
jgi:NhaP-type Na+/H+ or K+/H+ antiporter